MQSESPVLGGLDCMLVYVILKLLEKPSQALHGWNNLELTHKETFANITINTRSQIEAAKPRC
ncbi:MAG: hypothetical protein K0S39_880 [Paenibacillus sp.]|jgi:hypothetical protein|nr:hypothetical protein [Paenibacillus sp.]